MTTNFMTSSIFACVSRIRSKTALMTDSPYCAVLTSFVSHSLSNPPRRPRSPLIFASLSTSRWSTRLLGAYPKPSSRKYPEVHCGRSGGHTLQWLPFRPGLPLPFMGVLPFPGSVCFTAMVASINAIHSGGSRLPRKGRIPVERPIGANKGK